MRVYTKAGDLVVTRFSFSDSQPHIKVELHDREFDEVTIEMALDSPAAVLEVLLLGDVLRNLGYSIINLDVRYLLGARMDRAISPAEPFTLHTVARLINSGGFNRVRILDPHSSVATRLIRNSETVLPTAQVKHLIEYLNYPYICAPDKGASERVRTLAGAIDIQGHKIREVATGAIIQITVESLRPQIAEGRSILIIDDICDGGRTFMELARELKAVYKPRCIDLFVTHGIFSLGSIPLTEAGIRSCFTTNSFPAVKRDGLTVLPISM